VRYTTLVAKNMEQAAADMSKVMNMDIQAEPKKVEAVEEKKEFGLFSKEFMSHHGLHLLGTASTWFLHFTVRIFSKRISSVQLVGFRLQRR
jgi:MFS transporter, PHS family, inorganic phosphate transporter